MSASPNFVPLFIDSNEEINEHHELTCETVKPWKYEKVCFALVMAYGSINFTHEMKVLYGCIEGFEEKLLSSLENSRIEI